ncbi:hypothetical protein M0805_001061 [Coniferiporia weirii]|nr:hypothetical protein M0805_001061 [Coniferiporia weirii]
MLTPSVSTAFLALTCAVLAGSASALLVPFKRVSSITSHLSFATVTGGSKDESGDPFSFQNSNNASDNSDIYVTTLSVSGQDFVVQLDTGSSDLWLDTQGVNFSDLIDTGVNSSITYSDGTSASGQVCIGNVTFGEFTVSQAFISAPGSNAVTNRDNGLLGVGPSLLSVVNDSLWRTEYNGNTLLNNIFASDPSLPQLSTVSLSRSFATGKTDGGVYTIGEIDSNFSAISSSPRLDVVSPDRWIVLMDNLIVNGQNISGDSAFSVEGQDTDQTLANLDTGTSFATIPEKYANAIYGSVPGAVLHASSGVYEVPCDTKINVSFVFGGVAYPVHPIDTVVAMIVDGVDILCYSGFFFTSDTSGTEDFLLGDTFLRNVYSLFSFGAFVNGTSSPYTQLLSMTGADQAYAEFDSLSKQRNQTLLSAGSSSRNSAALSVLTKHTDVALVAIGMFFVGLLLV